MRIVHYTYNTYNKCVMFSTGDRLPCYMYTYSIRKFFKTQSVYEYVCVNIFKAYISIQIACSLCALRKYMKSSVNTACERGLA